MRTFDNFEKKILIKLKKYYEGGILQNYISLLDDEFDNKEIVIDKTNNIVTIGFDYDKYMPNGNNAAYNLIEEVNHISRVLIKTIFLLKYLEDNGYVFMFNESKLNNSPNKHSRITSSKRPIGHEIADKNVCSIIIDYFTKTILISQAIIDLVNDNFISKEEIRHNESIKLSTDNLNEAKYSVQLAEKSIKSAKEGLNLSQKSIKISEANLTEAQRSVKISEANLTEAQKSIEISKANLVEAKKDVKTGRIGVTVAIIVGLFSLILSTISIVKSNKSAIEPLQIDSIQYSNIERRIDSLVYQQEKMNTQIDSFAYKMSTVNLDIIYVKMDKISDILERLDTIKPSR